MIKKLNIYLLIKFISFNILKYYIFKKFFGKFFNIVKKVLLTFFEDLMFLFYKNIFY